MLFQSTPGVLCPLPKRPAKGPCICSPRPRPFTNLSPPPEDAAACVRCVGLLPACLSEYVHMLLVQTILYFLYGMYLAVLAKCMAAYSDERDRPRCTLYVSVLQPGKQRR